MVFYAVARFNVFLWCHEEHRNRKTPQCVLAYSTLKLKMLLEVMEVLGL